MLTAHVTYCMFWVLEFSACARVSEWERVEDTERERQRSIDLEPSLAPREQKRLRKEKSDLCFPVIFWTIHNNNNNIEKSLCRNPSATVSFFLIVFFIVLYYGAEFSVSVAVYAKEWKRFSTVRTVQQSRGKS